MRRGPRLPCRTESPCVGGCSCGGPLLGAEGVIGLGKMSMDQSWLLGGQHALAMGLEQGRGRANGCSGGVERPANMLARMPAADRDAVVREHVIVKCGDQRVLDRERRLVGALAAGEIGRD